MSLTKLFSKNYFVQNILKSKAIMALIIGIIPILNAIFLMAVATGTDNVVIGNLTEISILNIIGMYILPVVLSLCLFGYVFKKKSVDFINSMPLTRKTIYITNSIGGILLIIVMMLINVLLLFLESLIFTNLIIPFAMIIDYFIVWTVSYIFVFTAANVATSVSGNHVTMLVVTAIIVLLVPFMHHYLTGFNGNLYYTPHYITEVVSTEDVKTYEKEYINVSVEKIEEDTDYTLPYNYISSVFKGNVTTYSTESIIKMIVLSVVYFVCGMYLFERRKMEVNETSFKSNNVHMIVKSLTLLPIGALAIILMEETSSFMVNLFIFGLVIAYCFIYDIITTKTIRSIKLGIIYFVATAVLSVGLYYGAEYLNENVQKKDIFKAEDITGVALYIDEIDYTQKYNNNKMDRVYLDNEELLNVIKGYVTKSQGYKEYYMTIYLKVANNKEYKTTLYLDLDEYNKLVELALKDEAYLEEYRNIDYSKVQVINVGDITLTGAEMDTALVKIKEAVDNANLKNAYTLPNMYTTIELELYQNHENVTYSIPINISKELLSDYVKLMNKNTANVIQEDIMIYDVRIFNYSTLLSSSYASMLEDEHREYLMEYMKNNKNENVDVTLPLVRIRGTVHNDGDYYTVEYYTNNLETFIQVLKESAGGDMDE